MRAVVCKTLGPISDLEIGELPEPRAGAEQVVINVEAVGLNFLDTLIVQGKYQVRPSLPFAPGCEVSGVVRDLGPGVTGLSVGQRVVAFTAYGSLAEQVVADAAATYAIPDGMSHVDAAGFLIAHATSHHALARRAQLREAETLLVLGASGGVGLAAVEIARRLGAHVIAAASTDGKLQLCRQYGADHLVNYSRDDLRVRISELTAGRGVDIVYDPVGGKFTETALRSLAFLGRYLVVGFAAGDISSIPANRLLLKSASAMGVAWGAFVKFRPVEARADVQTLIDWHVEGGIRPHISQVMPLEKCVEALEGIAARRSMGKVVLTVGNGQSTRGSLN